MGAELENQTHTVTNKQVETQKPTEVKHGEVTVKTETTPQQTQQTQQSQPSLEEVMSLLANSDNDSLMQLAPVKELIQTARKQEKDKLYKTLEQKENEAKEFQEKLTAAQETLKQYESENLSFEEKMQLELEKVKQEQQALVQALQAEKEQAEAEARKNRLEAYKAEKLRLAGDELILELVGGETEEAIDQSIERAKAKYQEIASKFLTQAKTKQQEEVKQAFSPTAPSSTNVQPITREEINRMSAEEYAKNRDRIMEAMKLGIIE